MITVEELQQKLREAEKRKQKLSEAFEAGQAAARAKSNQEANVKALKAAESVPGSLARHKELEARLQDALRRHDQAALELVSLWSTIREKTVQHREIFLVLREKHGQGDLGIPLHSRGEELLSEGFLNRVKAVCRSKGKRD